MSQNVYDKLGDIKEATDEIRGMVAEDLKNSEVLCSTIEELPDYVQQAINNNLQYYVAWIFTTDPTAQLPDTDNLWINTSDGTVINLPEGWTQQGPLNQVEPSPQTYNLRRSNSEPEITVDQEVWMSYATFNSRGKMTSMFSPKMKMTGTKGEPGVDGLNGTIFEEIYILGNAAVKPNKPISNQIVEDLPYDSIYDRSWTRYPSGVTNDTPIEYYSKRYYDDSMGVWGEWSNPVAWSQFGREGRDGKHIEYIFCVGDEQGVVAPYSDPNKDETEINWPLEVEGLGKTYRWYDDPPSNLQPTQVIWCSIRHSEESIGESGHSVLKWGPYSTPTIWARYSADGKEGGGRYVTAYCVAKDGYKPAKPSGGRWDVVTQKVTAPVDPNGIVTWYDHPPTRNAGEIIWMSSASFHSSGHIIGEWSDPVQLTVDGINGKDGDSIQFIYRLLHSVEDFEILKNFHALAREKGIKLESNQSSDEAPNKIDKIASSDFANFGISSFDWEQEGDYWTICKTDWTDEPQGINLTNLVECACTRTKSANGLWSDWSDPVPWSVWGKDGMDGEGVEYIFMVTPKMIEIDGEEQDFLEYYRDLNAKGEVPEWLWIPTREDYEAYDQEHGTNWAETFGKYEFCPGVSDGNIFGIQDWHDEPQDVDVDQPYEWVAIRKKEIGTTEDGNENEYIGEWGNFNSPKLWNKFASDGRSSVMAYAFTRSNKPLNELLRKINDQIDFSPKGGDWDRPIPDDTWYMDTETGVTGDYIVWSDSVPGNTDDGDIWMVSRFFSSKGDSNNDGETVDDTWSIPCKMTDRSDFQVEFVGYCEKDGVVDPDIWPKPENFNTFYNSASGANKLENAEKAWREAEKEKGWSWGDDETDPVWMATCRLKNGKWTDWHVVKVKGETGTAGTSVKIIGSAKLIKDCTLNMTDPSKVQIMPDGKIAFYVLYYCDSDGGVSAGEGVMYKWMDPNDVDIPANVETKGYYKYKDYYTLSTGDGWLIDGELWVWDGDSYENVGQIQGPPGEADRLYIAFSDDDAVTEKNSNIDVDLKLTTGKYIGYYAGPALLKDALEKSSTYNWSKWKGQDGWGQEQVFLLTKEIVSDKVTITRDQGPLLPSENKEQHEWRPRVNSIYTDYVSFQHEIIGNVGDYLDGEYRWSDTPLTPSSDYPFCWVATRNTSNWKWKGDGEYAVLYSNYVESGKDAIYLELSEDSVSVPLDMSGEIDLNNDDIAFDLTATLYSGRDKISNDVTIKYCLEGGEEKSSDSELISIKVSDLNTYFTEQQKLPYNIKVVAEWEGGSWEKTCKINYGTALYELTVSKSVLHKDLATGFLYKDYDKVNVYVKRWLKDTWISASGERVYCDITKLDGTHDTKYTDTDLNGNAEFDSLSTIENISNVEFYILDKYSNQICNETVGVIANGKDGAWQEFIYRLYPEEVTGWSDLPTEWTPDVNASTTNKAGQKYEDPDYVPNDWFDDPQEVSYEEKYQYVSVRKRSGESGWGPFSIPTLWSRMDVNLQVHMPSESIIVYNSHENKGLSKGKTVSIKFVVTENENSADIRSEWVSLDSQTKDNESTDVWEIEAVYTPSSNINRIDVRYIGEDTVMEGTSYNLDFAIKYKKTTLHASHTIRLTQGGGENATYLSLTEDNAVYNKGLYSDNNQSKVENIGTTASLYYGNELVDDVEWEVTPNNCTVTVNKTLSSCEINVDSIDFSKKDISVDIYGHSASRKISGDKTFRIRVIEDHVWSLSFDQHVVNIDGDNKMVTVDVLYDGVKQTALGTNKIKYAFGGEETEYTGELPLKVDLSSDRDEVVFELLDSNGKILDKEGVGVVYNGKGASYFTISANYESCVLKDGEEKTIYPVVRLVKDNEDSGEIWQLKDFQSTKSFYEQYNKYTVLYTDGTSYDRYTAGIAGSLSTKNKSKYVFVLGKDDYTVTDSDPRFELLITRVKDGDKGDIGKSPVIYPAGKYDSSITYKGNSTSAPYVYTVGSNGNPSGYYIAYGEGKSFDPTSESNQIMDPDWNNVDTGTLKWVPMNQYEAIYSDIGILKTALVGQWVFYKEWMFSQQGKSPNSESMNYSSVEDWANWQSEFTPNILFNAKTGAGSFGAGAITLGDGSDNTTVGGWEVTGNGLVATNGGKEIAKLGNDGSGYLGSYTDNDSTYKGIQWDNTSLILGNNLKITNDGFIASDNLSNPTSYFKLSEWEAQNGDKSQYLSFKASNKSGFRTNSDDRFGLAVYGNGAYDDNVGHNGALTVTQGTSAYGLFVGGTAHIQGDLTVTGQLTTSDGTYTSSDERLKNFYNEVEVDLDSISQINKKYFSYKDSDKIQIGVSAQEVQKLYPELIGENDGYLTVAYDKLSVIALKAIDVLHQDNLKLKAEIEELKKLIAR